MSQVDDGTPDIPAKSWTNPFELGTPLHDLYDEVVRQNRDTIILIDDHNGRRGTGKTVASLQLADGMDQTDEGIISDKVTMRPEELREAYFKMPKRSALVLDEGEVGASNRQAMTKVNQILREIMSIGRVEEKYVIINSPLIGFLDKDIRKLADVWISMTKRGEGLVHFFEWESYSERLMTPQKQWIRFDDIEKNTQLRRVYNELTREKRKVIRGEEGESFLTKSEHREKIKRMKKEQHRETRDEIVRGLLKHPEVQASDVSQRVVAEAIGVSQGTISNAIRGDD